MAQKKIQQFYIVKLDGNKILDNNLNINYDLKEARMNGEVVSVGDSQVLRVIRRVVGREVDFNRLDELIAEKNRLKRNIKKFNERETKNRLFEVLREIDYYLYIPEYVSVVNEKRSKYNKIAKKGFFINGQLYIRFMCSAGNARTNTAFFIRADIFDEVAKILQNGHREVEIAEAKYNAYFSLSASATLEVSTPNVIVVPDCVVKRKELIDKVTLKDNIYEVNEANEEIEFNLWDGMGLISPNQAKLWADELGLDYVPSGFLIRAPFIKGMVFVFDFHKFAYDIAPTRYVKDIYGKERHIDSAEVIITESQFKLWKGFDNWEYYRDNMIKNGLSWGVTKFPPKFEKDFIRTNYQFIQVLNLNQDEIEGLCNPTIEWLQGVTGFDENYIKLYLLGKLADFEDVNDIWKNIQDPFIKALLVDSNVRKDKYIQNKIVQSIQKKIKESYIGKLIIDGNFQVMISDPYALCEHIFGMEVKGLLKRDEYYSKYWNDRNIDIVAGMRSPLTWRSEVNKMPLIKNYETDEWYKYLDSGIVYNVFGYDVLKHAGSDYDGDIVCTTSNQYFVNNMYGGKPVLGDHASPKKSKITKRKLKSLYKFDGKAFNTKIGFITNCSTTMYEMLGLYEPGSVEYNTIIDRLKLCCHFQALQIDSAKGIVVQSMPKDWTNWTKPKEVNETETIDKQSKEDIERKNEMIYFNNSILIEKRPYFMRYLYPNYNKEFKEYNEMYNQICRNKFRCSIDKPTNEVINNEDYLRLRSNYLRYNKFLDTDGVMNRVCHYMENSCKDMKLKLKDFGNSSFYNIYMDSNIQIDDDKLKMMLDRYDEYNSKKKDRKNFEEGNSFQKYCNDLKDEMFIVSIDDKELANLAIYICYVMYPNKPKDFAWDICGDGILQNLIDNQENKTLKIPKKNEGGDIKYLGKKYKVEEIEFNGNNI